MSDLPDHPTPDSLERRQRRRLKRPPVVHKWRLALVLFGLGVIAFISLAFGALTGVSADLPGLENRQEYRHSANSILYDTNGKQLGVLTGPKNRYLAPSDQIAPSIKHAVISVEDRRFYENTGIDLRGMGRALWSDLITGAPVQGASTISQQFVKNALSAANQRTVFQKIKEAALAYHLNRKWSKDKILSEYLNTIYFGEGAYGVESAARVYFGKAHPGCGESAADPYCAADLDTAEAAMVAGIIASPIGFDPIAHPVAATQRRNIVLSLMRNQGFITEDEYQRDRMRTVPDQYDITPPTEDSKAPYFTSWAKNLLVAKLGSTKTYTGGLRIKTTLDLDLQKAAENAVYSMLPPDSGGPTASLVAIDNKSGAVRAMVGGPNFKTHPFNLATQGHRQPGSSFKPFTLAVALQKGISVNSVWESRRKIFTVPHTGGKEFFIVNNYENSYAGSRSLADAMVTSDNSVYAELGIKVGTTRIAKMANRMGVRSPISTNYAVTLGGLKEGVSPLDMAHAYETFATRGLRVDSANGLGGTDGGPVGIESIKTQSGKLLVKNSRSETRVMSSGVADTVSSVLQSVVSSGTGKAAASGGFAAGKTGTTENYGDAWFVGWNEKYTVAVWVGYPDKVKSMATDYSGGPVAGGTFPAEIWHNFITSAQTILQTRASAKASGVPANQVPTDGGSSDGNQTYPSYSGGTGGGGTGGGGGSGNTSGAGGGGGGSGGGSGGSGGGSSGGGGSGGGSSGSTAGGGGGGAGSGGTGAEGGSGPTG